MAVGYNYELYVDGERKFYSNSSFEIIITEDRFIDTSGAPTGSYTYEEGAYLGWTTTQGGNTPDYVVGNTIIVPGKVYLYSILATTSSGSMYLGTSTISKMYLGQNEVSKVYFGQHLVYEKQATQLGSFTIQLAGGGFNPQTFNFEIGMTWAEFINSQYNAGNYFTDVNPVMYHGNVVMSHSTGSWINVYGSDTIVNGETYGYASGGRW